MNEISLIGVEDGGFTAINRDSEEKTILCSTLIKDCQIKAIELRHITVDGSDATEMLLDMLRRLSADVILLSGVSFAGFNVIDAVKVYRVTNIPVIVFIKEKPNTNLVREALIKHFPDWPKRLKIIEDLGEIFSGKMSKGNLPVYFEAIGVKSEYALEILRKSVCLSRIPEPIRIAGLIAKGLTKVG